MNKYKYCSRLILEIIMFIEVRKPNFKSLLTNPLIDQFKRKHQSSISKLRTRKEKKSN